MTTPTASPRDQRRRLWPVAIHAPVVAFLTTAVLMTDDRALTWTRLSEGLLELVGLPLIFVVGQLLALSPVYYDWMSDAALIASAWLNVVVLAVVTRHGVPARPVLEGAALVTAGVGIWAALLSWADEAVYGLTPSLAASLLVLATVALLSSRRPPVLVAVCVGSGAFVAVCAHLALNTAFWIFVAVPLGIASAGALAVAARLGARLGQQGNTPSS